MPITLVLFVDKQEYTALVDTGASVSVMREGIRRQLRKVVTPCSSRVLRSANGDLMEPLVQCTSRVEIGGAILQVSFFVLSSCSHSLILGWDFLAEAEDVVDCSRQELYMADIVLNTLDNVVRLCADDDYIVGPKMTRSVQVLPDKGVSGFVGYESPVTDLFLEKSVVVPHCLITISQPGNFLWVQNYAMARGTCVGHFMPVDDSSVEAVNTSDTHVGHEHQVTSPQGDDQDFYS